MTDARDPEIMDIRELVVNYSKLQEANMCTCGTNCTVNTGGGSKPSSDTGGGQVLTVEDRGRLEEMLGLCPA
jgi:hypothetical protein